MRGVGRVGAHGVVHDPFEHGGCDDAHAVHHAVTDDGRGHELPPGVDLARGDVRGDPAAAVARGEALLTASGEAIIAGVEANGATYVMRRANEVLDAWGRHDAAARADANEQLRDAAGRAVTRVVDELRATLRSDPARQRRTPLEIVRTLRREPSDVLAALGVPPVVRDTFEERSLPDDPYALAPRSFADLGDADLAAMQLTWGVGKATVLRARAALVETAQVTQNPVENLSIEGREPDTRRSSLGITRAARKAAENLRVGIQRRRSGRE
jgi:hypothetical protein